MASWWSIRQPTSLVKLSPAQLHHVRARLIAVQRPHHPPAVAGRPPCRTIPAPPEKNLHLAGRAPVGDVVLQVRDVQITEQQEFASVAQPPGGYGRVRGGRRRGTASLRACWRRRRAPRASSRDAATRPGVHPWAGTGMRRSTADRARSTSTYLPSAANSPSPRAFGRCSPTTAPPPPAPRQHRHTVASRDRPDVHGRRIAGNSPTSSSPHRSSWIATTSGDRAASHSSNLDDARRRSS